MERNLSDINRDFRGTLQAASKLSFDGTSFFSDLTKKLVSSAGEKVGEALENKLFKKPPPKVQSKDQKHNENKGSELVKLLKAERKAQRFAELAENKQPALPQSNIHEIYNRLLSD